MKKSLVLLFITITFSFSVIGQSKVNYSQRMATPSYFFPELTGWHGGLQANLQYRNQWPGIASNYLFYCAGVDGYSEKLHSGFGINFGHERFGTGIHNNNNIELNWSPKLITQNGLTFMPAMSGKYNQTNIDWSQYDFTDPNSPYYDPNLIPTTGAINTVSFGAGLGIIFKEAFAVAHVHDINQPNQSFFAGYPQKLPRMYSFLAGRVFTHENFKVTPSISYHNQAGFNMLTVACNVQYRWIYAGAKYDFNGFTGVALGAEIKERVRLSYSYDIINNPLGAHGVGAHEIALRVWLYKDRAKKQFLSNLPLM